MNKSVVVRMVALAVCTLVPVILIASWTSSAGQRLERDISQSEKQPADYAVAAAANEEYCSVELKRILRRVLRSCGLIDAEAEHGGDSARGCQPVDAQQVAQMSGGDFNALFIPMKERGGIIQFEQGQAELDQGDRDLLGRIFSDQRGASYFFVVARASPEGSVQRNRELSQKRAEALMAHLRQTFNDPQLDREVGLLWLGEEFAQLDENFCQWQRSGATEECKAEELNRSAFVAWVDCRL